MDELQHSDEPVVFEPELEPQGPLHDTATEPTVALPRGFSLKLYFALLAASLLGTLAILPFSYTLLKQMDTPIPEGLIPVALAATVVIELLLSAAMIALGLGLGPRLEMGWLSVEPESSTGESSLGRRLWLWVGEPLVIGIALGLSIVVTLWSVEVKGAKDKALSMPNAWEGLLASIGAGIREEIWLRLGLLTFIVWLGVKLIRAYNGQQSTPPAQVFWIANLVSALSFAAIHIPQAQMLMGLTVQLLVFVFVGNGVPGLVFGWLYWRRGLIAAMVAHFGLDLVLKVLLPLFS